LIKTYLDNIIDYIEDKQEQHAWQISFIIL
jgi:hypothetical protein